MVPIISILLIPPPSGEVVQAWLGFLTPLMMAILILVQIFGQRESGKRADTVAKKVDTVAEVAATNAERANLIAEKTHALVNSRYGLVLSALLKKSIEIANLRGSEEDKAEVIEAERNLREHEARQHTVDLVAGLTIPFNKDK